MLSEQVAILEGYLPKQVTGDELTALIGEVLAETGASTKKALGRVMGDLTQKPSGNFDKAAAAKELIFLGERIDAKRALALGAVNRVVPDEALFDEALAFAEKLARRAPLALAAVKKVIDFSVDEPDTEKATAYEQDAFAGLFATEDQKEGMRAFIEKRKPIFKGK